VITLISAHPWYATTSECQLRPDEVAEFEDARGLLQACTELKDKLLREKEECFNEARKHGIDEGRAEATRHMIREMARLAQSASKYVENFEHELLAIVSEALRSIIFSADDDTVIRTLATRALERAKLGRFLVLRVNPQHDDVGESITAQWRRDLHQIEWINLVKDPRVAPRSCVVETPAGAVHADLDQVMAALESVVAPRSITTTGTAKTA
jgi:type III secretion protein L